MTANWSEASEAVRQAKSILIVTHISPDGDAIGSLLGLANGLREMGKQVDAAVDGGVPLFLNYIPGQETVLGELKAGQWDLMVSVDASDEERTGEAGKFGRTHSTQVVNLDHHATNTQFGNFHLVVPEAASASEVVYDWLVYMGHPVSQASATALLTGMVTDTLAFRTSHVIPRTLMVAHDLMAAGAPLFDIINWTMVSRPISDFLLWQRVFPSVKYDDGIVSAVILPDDVKAVGLSDISDAGLVSTLVTADEVMIAIIFKVQEDNTVKLSMRSKVGYDVAQVAFALGGGGHKPAAGATVAGTLDEVWAKVMPMLREVVNRGKLMSG
ncbi:MAG: bifunctional oligoribonuclease/PAP phosphatase NrnA [Chloroflexi bacterium]|nr:bifunctional oligoribonuclease/PAP phosphatase NrnA [Chloroflexota bacterium]MCC6896472.1 bifunctional oligoribonuclease/PAP phosphatase NrnA [Anaerolineae bacterium]